MMAWLRVWSGLSASTSRVVVLATSAARALLGRIWCCLGVLKAGLPLLTLCAWRRRTLRRGRMSGATPSRTCSASGHPCVVGGQIVLVYESTSDLSTSRCASGGDGRGADGGGLGRPGRGCRGHPHPLGSTPPEPTRYRHVTHTLVVAAPAVQR